MKLLFISSKRFPGVSMVAENGRRLGFWGVFFVEDGIPYLGSYDGIIFGGYIENYKQIIERADCRKFLLWTSSPGQSQFHELPILERVLKLLNENRIDILFFGSKEFYEMFKENTNIKYLPYPIALTSRILSSLSIYTNEPIMFRSALKVFL